MRLSFSIIIIFVTPNAYPQTIQPTHIQFQYYQETDTTYNRVGMTRSVQIQSKISGIS